METTKESVREKILKVYQLTKSDVPGERQAAQVKLDLMCHKYGISVADIMTDVRKKCSFQTGQDKLMKSLLKQIYAYVLNTQQILYWEDRTFLTFELTPLENIEIRNLWNIHKAHYMAALQEAREVASVAYFATNGIAPENNTPEESEMTPEEKLKMAKVRNSMQYMERKIYHKQIQ